MNTSDIPALDVRQRLGELLERVYYQAMQYRIVRRDKVMARLVSEPMMQAIDELMVTDPAFADTLALMVNREATQVIEKSRQELATGKKIPIEAALK